MKRIYRGRIYEGNWGENWEALMVDTEDKPLSEIISEQIEEHGSFLSVRYMIAESEITGDLDTAAALLISGIGEAEYGDNYSEITGYLWTDQSLTIGGHDLLSKLRTSIGSYLWMVIDRHAKIAVLL